MASLSGIKRMREEATCSICLELMKEPVSIHCGHSFCRQCITAYFGKSLHCVFIVMMRPCPLCGTSFQRESLRPNKPLENLIESIKELERERLCEEHEERLHLFCEDDGQLICWRCERSPQHRGHSTALVEDVCPGYKEKLQEVVTKLKAQKDTCKSAKLFTRDQMTKWEENIELQKQKIQSDFENLINFLSEEKMYHLRRLEKGKEQTLDKLWKNNNCLKEQSQELKNHILQLEEKCQGSAQNLLQGVKDTLSRSSAVKLKVPKPVSLKLPAVCNVSELYFDMRKILRSYQVSVTLNPDTAHPELILSEDRRQVTRGSPQEKHHDSRRFSVLPCVLGCEGFTSGRRYFEVAVGDGMQWDIGVCLGSVPKNADVTLMPQSGFWAIRLSNGNCYEALTSPPTSLCLREKPTVVGLFLDCDAGLVHFYNVTTGSHIFTFEKFVLCDTIWPFFQVYHCSPLFLPPSEK
ncbi:E3 ubiquitin-protein ligase TRIM38-like isoform X2 [Talpa occidentalis]|nr:E3 ubiquitin-protein ligase TRIM38-like isoform X2 [Talpa occidentalis]XP_037374876.1 E3 ubiquitin-protein ligase TRIM38-like isoform X2 [Talpa occidentalis]